MTIKEIDNSTGSLTPIESGNNEINEKPKDIRLYLFALPSHPQEPRPYFVDWSKDSEDKIADMFRRESHYLQDEIEVVEERIKKFDPSIPKKTKNTNMPLSKRVKRDIEKNKKGNLETLGIRLDKLRFNLSVVEAKTIAPITLLGTDDSNINGYKIGINKTSF